ncbi:hypothetical protein H4R33_002306 [Dimargaris cristalligena]|uniref:Uncharacterized protein n=1 Tax=Dimargaris cristalligena TaxID=215637 RepID=A0A4P9ZXX4_9FUNG|nr:hypothetical protein H4R33_002306 [Dimargaris cristalligena]RKP38523.1 hypothetical protein BJ085DRAFT_35708 [Dimargaris cristalligena]|eukprot:RKP38523.1 hypothetical protein BJ085DRAFT_35708 [Dimargaris cristalligena]
MQLNIIAFLAGFFALGHSTQAAYLTIIPNVRTDINPLLSTGPSARYQLTVQWTQHIHLSDTAEAGCRIPASSNHYSASLAPSWLASRLTILQTHLEVQSDGSLVVDSASSSSSSATRPGSSPFTFAVANSQVVRTVTTLAGASRQTSAAWNKATSAATSLTQQRQSILDETNQLLDGLAISRIDIDTPALVRVTQEIAEMGAKVASSSSTSSSSSPAALPHTMLGEFFTDSIKPYLRLMDSLDGRLVRGCQGRYYQWAIGLTTRPLATPLLVAPSSAKLLANAPSHRIQAAEEPMVLAFRKFTRPTGILSKTSFFGGGNAGFTFPRVSQAIVRWLDTPSNPISLAMAVACISLLGLAYFICRAYNRRTRASRLLSGQKAPLLPCSDKQ